MEVPFFQVTLSFCQVDLRLASTIPLPVILLTIISYKVLAALWTTVGLPDLSTFVCVGWRDTHRRPIAEGGIGASFILQEDSIARVEFQALLIDRKYLCGWGLGQGRGITYG